MTMIPRRNKSAESGDATPPAATPAAQPTATAAPAATPAAQPAAPAATTAVATQGTTAVATRIMGKPKDIVAETYKDALPLDWNTLHRIQANQGNFLDLENSKKACGAELHLELMTFQDNWQISPGTDEPDDVQHVRYSNDGKTTTMGEDCLAYVAALKEANYTDAKMTHRCTLAGRVLATPGMPASGLVDELVQIDLPQTSKNMFDRYRFKASVDYAQGKVTDESAGVLGALRMTAKVVTQGKNSWTVVEFERLQSA